eukprot:CAMPEP_0171656140 /NCGR_PEP_ID=MMETSP0990-20121206/41381_1 /TAXON_ID=483369 /ORGANISM="non described non described, Strain CCMP2098" /LENGTH=67 /DNA_ID=CAMNT_0012236511 /DNA_START=43 /DNA_END=243 /DNA_ORIENTATION=-
MPDQKSSGPSNDEKRGQTKNSKGGSVKEAHFVNSNNDSSSSSSTATNGAETAHYLQHTLRRQRVAYA